MHTYKHAQRGNVLTTATHHSLLVIAPPPPSPPHTHNHHRQMRPWSGERLEPLRRLLRELDPLITADAVNRLSFADLRDRLLAFDPLDVEHVERVNAAEAEFWRATEGVTMIGDSDQVRRRASCLHCVANSICPH
jgi:L-galactono-1,4-lactone dehydrogenase